MHVLSSGLIFFSIAFILHFIIWKIRVPRRQTNALLAIFFSVCILGIFLFAKSGFFESLYIFVLFSSLTLAYVITYSAIEVDSPSLSLVMAFVKSGRSGLNREDISKFMTDEKLVICRINDLLRDKLIYKDPQTANFKLTTSGRNFVTIFVLYRRLLGAQRGG